MNANRAYKNVIFVKNFYIYNNMVAIQKFSFSACLFTISNGHIKLRMEHFVEINEYSCKVLCKILSINQHLWPYGNVKTWGYMWQI
jgi:hypothetical protein